MAALSLATCSIVSCSRAVAAPSANVCRRPINVQASVPAGLACGGGLLPLQTLRRSAPLRASRRGGRTVTAMAKSSEEDIGTLGLAAVAAGLVANPVVAYSLFVLKTTGCGLPPGPGGLYGAIEGVSYLVVVGVAGWSIYKKVKTGSGLPAGPYGLLGAVEGVTFLVVLASIVVFGFQVIDYGYIPSATPDEKCFG